VNALVRGANVAVWYNVDMMRIAVIIVKIVLSILFIMVMPVVGLFVGASCPTALPYSAVRYSDSVSDGATYPIRFGFALYFLMLGIFIVARCHNLLKCRGFYAAIGICTGPLVFTVAAMNYVLFSCTQENFYDLLKLCDKLAPVGWLITSTIDYDLHLPTD
jgi:hypothetical protein